MLCYTSDTCHFLAELVQAVKRDDSTRVLDLLRDRRMEDFNKSTFHQCLSVCARSGFLDKASLLLMPCARNRLELELQAFSQQAKENEHFQLSSFFRLCQAAYTPDIPVFEAMWSSLLEKDKDKRVHKKVECVDEMKTDGVKCQPCHQCTVTYFIRPCVFAIAFSYGHSEVAKAALLHKSDCSQDAKTVDWHGYVMREIHPSWLEAVGDWVQKIKLSSNCLSEVGA